MPRWCVLLLAVWLGAGADEAADALEGYPFVSFDEAMRLSRQSGKPIFLYFGRYGCTWCDTTNKEALSDLGVKRLYGSRYIPVYTDAESGRRLQLPSGERITEAELGARLGAFATPLFVFLNADGEVLVRVPGVRTVQDFLDFDTYERGGHYRDKTSNELMEEGS